MIHCVLHDPNDSQVAARISRLEGVQGCAHTGDIRLRKYHPEERFDLGTRGGHGG